MTPSQEKRLEEIRADLKQDGDDWTLYYEREDIELLLSLLDAQRERIGELEEVLDHAEDALRSRCDDKRRSALEEIDESRPTAPAKGEEPK